MDAPLYIELRGRTLELTLQRPERRNALTRALIAGVTQALTDAAADERVRCVLLTGAPPAFCAGLDLHETLEASTPAESTAESYDVSAFAHLLEVLDACPKPTIAAVNGPAAAGGAALAALCDVAVCAASARIGFPGIRRGLVAPVLMPYLLRLVGARRAKLLLLTGEMLDAPVAREYGLITEVTPDADVLRRARAAGDELAGFDPAALAQTKAWLGRLRDLQFSDAVPAAQPGLLKFSAGEDRASGPATV